MKFRLKTLLFTLCGVGATVGMLGNLLLRNPEVFLIILYIGSTILPFVLATGTIIWIGVRGKRRPGLVAWGVLLVLAPIVVQGALSVLWPSRDPLRILSNQRLIETRLPARINEPWVWNELERRLAAGKLSNEEVDLAVRQLIAMMTATSPKGWNQPLPWQHNFLAKVMQANMVSSATFVELCDAFYGTQPAAKVDQMALPSGRMSLHLNMKHGNPWYGSGVGVELLWQVGGVAIDGTTLPVKQVQRFAQDWNAFCEGKWPPGDHEITFDVECAYVDASLVSGTNASTVPVAQWPTAIKRWKTSVSVPLKIEESSTK